MKVRYLVPSYSDIQERILGISKTIPYETAEYLDQIVYPYVYSRPCKKEVFEHYCDVQFENLIVRNIIDYDTYLKSVFGNYKQLPPKEQQVTHHGFQAYWKEID